MTWAKLEERRITAKEGGEEYTKLMARSEADLNKAFARVFTTDDGRLVLTYLEAASVNLITKPDLQSSALHHVEGRRFIVRNIIDRILKGIDGK